MTCTLTNPAIVVWARKNSGKSIEQIARRLQLEVEDYLEVEDGKKHLSLGKLRTLAHTTNRPMATFYLPSPPADVKSTHDYRSSGGSISSEGMLSFRKSEKVQELTQIRLDTNSDVLKLKVNLAIDPSLVALEARTVLGITEDLQSNSRSSKQFTELLIDKIDKLGIHILFHSYPIEDSRAYTLPGNPPVIVINKRDYLSSQLFSLLHEFAHILLRKPGMCDSILSNHGGAVETYCHKFASNFILPEIWFKNISKHYSDTELLEDDNLQQLAAFFSTSKDVIIIRLTNIGRVSQIKCSEIRAKWKQEIIDERNKRKGGRTSIKSNALNDNGSLFINEVGDAYASNKIGVVEASEMLSINPSYLEDVVGVMAGGT